MIEAKIVKREDVASVLAKHIVSLGYAGIPREAAETSKKCILDTLGVILGASGTVPGCRELAELITEAGGKPESTIIGFGGKVPAWMAAFVNGGMGHGLDYDDIHSTVVVHPSACVVPAAFATAERVGQINGRDFITAVTLGIDMACRLGLAIDWEHDWHLSPVFGAFACAAASGKLLGLNEAKLVDAFGIALCQAACTMELNFGLGSNLRGAYPGFADKAGVLSACMAQRGIDGPKNSFEGKAGLFPVYFKGRYNRETLVEDLGKRFEGVNLRFKPWPVCTVAQSFIEATLDIVREQDIRPEDVEGVTVFVGDESLSLCEPLEGRQKPATTLDAKRSIPFTVAVAIARRNVTIADYTVENLKAPAVLRLAEKVVPKYDKQFNKAGDIYPAEVEINARGGIYRKRVNIPYGHTERPMNMNAIVEKFKDCARHSAKPLAQGNIERVIETVTRLEEVADVSQVMRSLG